MIQQISCFSLAVDIRIPCGKVQVLTESRQMLSLSLTLACRAFSCSVTARLLFGDSLSPHSAVLASQAKHSLHHHSPLPSPESLILPNELAFESIIHQDHRPDFTNYNQRYLFGFQSDRKIKGYAVRGGEATAHLQNGQPR